MDKIARPYAHEPDRYGYGGRPHDCPHCGAMSPDYCPLVACAWANAAEPDALTGCADDQGELAAALATVDASEAGRIVRHALQIMKLRSLLQDMLKADEDGVFGEPAWHDREAELWRRVREAIDAR